MLCYQVYITSEFISKSGQTDLSITKPNDNKVTKTVASLINHKHILYDEINKTSECSKQCNKDIDIGMNQSKSHKNQLFLFSHIKKYLYTTKNELLSLCYRNLM